MNSAKPCSICGESCKSIGACRSLRLPPDGFYTGGGGGGGHNHDEDESCVYELRFNACQPFAQTCLQDDEVLPIQPTQVWVLHMIPNTPSNGAV